MSKGSSVSSDSKVIFHMQVSSEEYLNHSFVFILQFLNLLISFDFLSPHFVRSPRPPQLQLCKVLLEDVG